MTEKEFGLHLILDLEKCDRGKLIDNKFIYGFLNKIVSLCSMKPLIPPYIVEYKDPWASTPGLTGFVVIAESHVSIHTFPDNNYVFLDIFSCKTFESESIIEFIKKELNAKKATLNIIERGRNFHLKIQNRLQQKISIPQAV